MWAQAGEMGISEQQRLRNSGQESEDEEGKGKEGEGRTGEGGKMQEAGRTAHVREGEEGGRRGSKNCSSPKNNP